MRMVPASSSPRRATTTGIASIEQRRTAAITCTLVLSRGSIALLASGENMAVPRPDQRACGGGSSGREEHRRRRRRRQRADRFDEALRCAAASLLDLLTTAEAAALHRLPLVPAF